MSNKVLLKKSSVLGKVPATSDLDYGELALNYADGLLYFKNASNTVQSFAAYNSATVTLTATQTLTNKTLTSPTLNTPSINGGSVSLANGTLIVPTSASPAQTDVGAIVYDTAIGTLTIGTGSGRKSLVEPTASQTLTNKTLTSPTINGGAVSGTFSGAHTYSGAITVSDSTASTTKTTGALKVTGGVGVGDSVYVGNRVGYVNASNVSVVYQYYNSSTGSLDTVFG
jgi:hypothetical protein